MLKGIFRLTTKELAFAGVFTWTENFKGLPVIKIFIKAALKRMKRWNFQGRCRPLYIYICMYRCLVQPIALISYGWSLRKPSKMSVIMELISEKINFTPQIWNLGCPWVEVKVVRERLIEVTCGRSTFFKQQFVEGTWSQTYSFAGVPDSEVGNVCSPYTSPGLRLLV